MFCLSESKGHVSIYHHLVSVVVTFVKLKDTIAKVKSVSVIEKFILFSMVHSTKFRTVLPFFA